MKNYYEILGIGPSADYGTIKHAYRRMVSIYHPDTNQHPQAHQQFLLVQEAYETLTNPRQKQQYDALFYMVYHTDFEAIFESIAANNSSETDNTGRGIPNIIDTSKDVRLNAIRLEVEANKLARVTRQNKIFLFAMQGISALIFCYTIIFAIDYALPRKKTTDVIERLFRSSGGQKIVGGGRVPSTYLLKTKNIKTLIPDVTYQALHIDDTLTITYTWVLHAPTDMRQLHNYRKSDALVIDPDIYQNPWLYLITSLMGLIVIIAAHHPAVRNPQYLIGFTGVQLMVFLLTISGVLETYLTTL